MTKNEQITELQERPPKIQITYTYDPATGKLNVDWPASNPVVATFMAIWGWEFIKARIAGTTQQSESAISRPPPGFMS